MRTALLAAFALAANAAPFTGSVLGFFGASLCGIANGNTGDLDTTTGVLMGGSQRVHDASGYLAIRDAATVNPVPEPSAFAALGVGALGLLRRRRSR